MSAVSARNPKQRKFAYFAAKQLVYHLKNSILFLFFSAVLNSVSLAFNAHDLLYSHKK